MQGKIKKYFNIIKNVEKGRSFDFDDRILVYSLADGLNIFGKSKGIIICADMFLHEIERRYINKLDLPYDQIIRGTSISDSKIYPQFCLAAAKDENLFQNFRRAYLYLDTVGAATKRFGERALKLIEKRIPKFSNDEWELFLQNDLFGNPYRHEFISEHHSLIADPNTFAYVMQLQEIIDKLGGCFKNKQIKKICEIGVGFGGFCRILCSYFEVFQYNLVDLPEALELALKYLGKFKINNKIYAINGIGEFDAVYSDLVISNYAFSELERSIQEKYMEKIIKNSSYGFMIWDRYSELDDNLKGMTREEFCERMRNVKVYEHELIEHRIIVWGI